MAPHLPLDRGARYGIGLMGTIFGGYILMSSDFSAVLQQEDYAGSLGSDIPLLNVVQFFVIMGVLVASFGIMPVAAWRRVLSVTVVMVVMFLWATLGFIGNAGVLDLDGQSLVAILVDHGFVTVLVVLGGWLIARGRSLVTLPLVLIAFAMPWIAQRMEDVGATSGAYALVTQGAAFTLCVGGAWLAVLIERLIRPGRRRAAAAAAREPSAG